MTPISLRLQSDAPTQKTPTVSSHLHAVRNPNLSPSRRGAPLSVSYPPLLFRLVIWSTVVINLLTSISPFGLSSPGLHRSRKSSFLRQVVLDASSRFSFRSVTSNHCRYILQHRTLERIRRSTLARLYGRSLRAKEQEPQLPIPPVSSQS
jgi:hypothetical protein